MEVLLARLGCSPGCLECLLAEGFDLECIEMASGAEDFEEIGVDPGDAALLAWWAADPSRC